MNNAALKLDLTTAEIDMCFVLFQTARQDKYTFDEINALMRKIQFQGKPQIEALAVKRNTDAALKLVKERKPRTPKAAASAPVVEKQQVAAGHTVVEVPTLPDLSDLKLD